MSKLDVLSPLRGEIVRREFAVVDIETKDGESQKAGFTRPFLAGYYDGLKFVAFRGERCLDVMLTFLLSPENDGMTYYAHNGGAFDWLHFLPSLARFGYSFEISTVQSKIQCLRVKPHKDSHRKGWTFLDSYQLIPTGLEKAAKALKAEVKKQEFFDYDLDESDPRWNDYLKDDCVALYKTLLNFYELIEEKIGGEVGMTTAATSMKTFRRRYQSKPIEKHSTYHEFFRAAYFGGRVEIFKKQGQGLHYYDINSSYPFSMLQPMPIGKLTEWKGKPPAWLIKERVGFARASVYVPPSTHIPLLPHRLKDGKLIFPTGSFSGVWPAVELLEAEKEGVKVTWHDSVWIVAEPIFGEMVHELYAYRDKSRPGYDEALAYVAKILLNSLYGKFATNTLREKIIYIEPDQDPPEGAIPAAPEDPECPIFTVEEEIDAPYIAPQISAHITALSRIALYRFMKEADRLGELVYCDTDSIITSADLSHMCGVGLGALKDEGAGVTYEGEFLQPKLYFLQGDDGSQKVVMKGYSTRNEESFRRVQLGETLSFESLERIGSMKRKGFLDGPKMRTVTRCIRGEDRKRVHLPDGTTRAIELCDGALDDAQFELSEKEPAHKLF